MILVDTSVIVDLFKGVNNKSTRKFKEILHQKIPFGINSFIYQEILQGAKSLKEFNLLKKYLESQHFFYPKHPVDSHAEAARIYFKCRKKGLTIRSTIDCLIAQMAIEHNLALLHNDKDFNAIAKVVKLKCY